MRSYWKGIYGIKTILEHSRITDESRLNNEFILDLIMQYRAFLIEQKFNKSMITDPIWWSNIGILETERVLSSDIPELITTGSFTMAKVKLPVMVQLRYDYQLMNLFTVSQQEKLYPLEFAKFMSYVMVNDDRIKNYYHIMPINEYAYIYPYIDRIQGRGILQNCLEGKIINTMIIPSGSIVSGIIYVVRTAQINYNGTIYSPGDTFTGIVNVSTFTGNGKVYWNNSQRSTTLDDIMPLSAGMYSDLRMMILTKEYGIEATKIPDMVDDSKPESIING